MNMTSNDTRYRKGTATIRKSLLCSLFVCADELKCFRRAVESPSTR
jgi:hypothetical protein